MEGKPANLYPDPGMAMPPPQYTEGKAGAPYPYPYPTAGDQPLYGPQYPLLDGRVAAGYPIAPQPLQPPLYAADGRQAVYVPSTITQPVVMLQVPAVASHTDASPPVRDHILWSIFNTVYLDCCFLGFIALVYSIKARDRIVVRDTEGAKSYANYAKRLNIAASTLTLLFYAIIIIFVLT